ncbi:MAG TPA: ComF family protein, partial [Gammaproteobacteria bacterium]
LVTGLKFHGQLAGARLLGGLLAEQLAGDPGPWPQALLPVPLHPRRLRQRGFNQALELARPLARELGLALLPDACVRRRDTAAQSGLERAARRRNVRGAFALPRPLGLHHVALVDDVMTTGQTLEALARVLREDGVEQVEVWCVARAGLEARPA